MEFNYVLSLKEIDNKLLAGINLSQKYYLSKGYYEQCRIDVLDFLVANSLFDQIENVSDSSLFNTLFISCKSDIKDQLSNISCVENVIIDGYFEVSLT